MNRKRASGSALTWALLAVPVLWLAAIFAYRYEDGMNLFDLMGCFTVLAERPFAIRWTPYTPGVGTSYLVTDPKGEVARALAPLLLEQGYDVQVFDLIDPSHSDLFNPFAYLRDDKDVIKLVNNLIKNTTPKGAQQNDPFWEKSEIALDSALILYLLHEAPPEEQNFEMVTYMIANGGAREDDDDYQSQLDLLFEALAEEQLDHIAVREYRIFQQAAGVICSKQLLNHGFSHG